MKLLGSIALKPCDLMGPKDFMNDRHELSVLQFAFTSDIAPTGVKPAAADVQHVADPGGLEALGDDDPVDGGKDVAYAFRPKMANAFFKMSRSVSTRLSSTSNRRTRSSRASAVRPDWPISSRRQR